MIKQVGLYVVSFGLLSFVGYNVYTVLLPQIASESRISLKEVYLFYGIFSLMLCTLLLLLSKKEKFKDQLGFLYLISVALKVILFCLVFYKHIFTKDSFTNIESINFLIPMILLLVLEVFFISKLLKNISPSKNAK